VPSYSPPWCPHVVGEFPDRVVDPATGEHEPQVVRLRCAVCGDQHQVTCTTGAVRQWVLRYGTVHLHRDPLQTGVPPRR
jgi:hypothetical protein